MKQIIHQRLVMTGAVVTMIAMATFAQKPVNDAGLLDSVTPAANLYHDDADAKKEIEAAVKSTAPTGKRVLLIFGANWCYDCHVLDQALHQGEAGQIVSENFLLVHVDIGEEKKTATLASLKRLPVNKARPR